MLWYTCFMCGNGVKTSIKKGKTSFTESVENRCEGIEIRIGRKDGCAKKSIKEKNTTLEIGRDRGGGLIDGIQEIEDWLRRIRGCVRMCGEVFGGDGR